MRVGVHATLAEHIHAGLGGANRGPGNRAGHVTVHDEIAVGVNVAVVVVAGLEGRVDLRVIELVQPVEQPSISVGMRGHDRA